MPQIPYVRAKEIIRILHENEIADISYLSNHLGVSEMTVRRDLERLEKDGDIIRIYGGAKLRKKSNYDPSIEERLIKNMDEKMAIGRKAAEFIEDGDVIALDASTTALEISKNIKARKKLTVITNNISIAIELSEENDITTILLGGIVRKRSLSLVGTSINDFLQNMHIDKTFISSKALSFEQGLTDATIDEGETKKALIKSSNSVIIVADHTKLNTVSFYKVCDYREVDMLIVDGLVPFSDQDKQCLKQFSENDVQVVIAK